jgi:hypothetical protein
MPTGFLGNQTNGPASLSCPTRHLICKLYRQAHVYGLIVVKNHRRSQWFGTSKTASAVATGVRFGDVSGFGRYDRCCEIS